MTHIHRRILSWVKVGKIPLKLSIRPWQSHNPLDLLNIPCWILINGLFNSLWPDKVNCQGGQWGRGSGVPDQKWSKSSLMIKESPSYHIIKFTRTKMFLPKDIKFWNIENTGSYSKCTKFNRDFPKIYFSEFQNLYSTILIQFQRVREKF